MQLDKLQQVLQKMLSIISDEFAHAGVVFDETEFSHRIADILAEEFTAIQMRLQTLEETLGISYDIKELEKKRIPIVLGKEENDY